MAKLKPQIKVRNTTSYDLKALVCIDFGNGQPKAILDIPGVDGLIEQTFPSIVQELPTPNSDCIRLVVDGGEKYFKVGHLDRNFEAYRTGKTATGKIDNARALLIEVIKRSVSLESNSSLYSRNKFRNKYLVNWPTPNINK